MSVLATSTPLTRIGEKAVETAKVAESAGADKDKKRSIGKYLENLTQVLCICYPINLGKKSMLALFDSDSKVNAVYPAFSKKLGLFIRPIDVEAQKIDGIILDIYGMIVVAFSIKNKANRVRFFEMSFLVTNVSPKVVFEMLCLTLRGVDVGFLRRKLR